MTMNTTDFLALPPQERFALIEEHIFGRMVFRNHVTSLPTYCRAGRGVLYKGVLVPIRNFDEPVNWWEAVFEMERRDKETFRSEFRKTPGYDEENSGRAVQAASLRAVGFITD